MHQALEESKIPTKADDQFYCALVALHCNLKHVGVSENGGAVPYFGVLIIRILLFKGTILGSPIFGNPHVSSVQIPSDIPTDLNPAH